MARIWESERAVPFIPETGKVYRNEAGGDYRCVDPIPSFEACWMRNTATGWEFIARNVGRYSDGSIDWDYSVQGHFEEADIYAEKKVPAEKGVTLAEVVHRNLALVNALLCMAI